MIKFIKKLFKKSKSKEQIIQDACMDGVITVNQARKFIQNIKESSVNTIIRGVLNRPNDKIVNTKCPVS